MLFVVGNKCDLEEMREVTPESVLEFKEMNNIQYWCETSAKSGKNVDKLFTDCAKFVYNKYKDRMGQVGNEGDLSMSDAESSFDNSFTSDNDKEFHKSGGHKASRLKNGKRSRRPKKKRNCKC